MDYLEGLLRQVESAGPWAPLLFVSLYVLGCILLVPGFFITSGAGLLFGFAGGFLTVWSSVALGSTTTFLIARYFGAGWARRKIAAHPHVYKLERMLERGGWQVVALIRLCPIFPFRLSNYAFGFTAIAFVPYFFGTMLGTLPSALTYSYIGSTLQRLGEILEGPKDAAALRLRLASLALGMASFVLLSLFLVRLSRHALARRI